MVRSRSGPPTALRWRVFALLALLACLVIGNTALTLAFEARLTGQTREKDSLHRTALVSERLLRTLDGQVGEVRGFALTGERSHLRGYALQPAGATGGRDLAVARARGGPGHRGHPGRARGTGRGGRRRAAVRECRKPSTPPQPRHRPAGRRDPGRG